MPLIQLVEVLLVVGVVLWLIDRYIPMQWQIKSILNGVVVIVVLRMLKVAACFGSLHNFALDGDKATSVEFRSMYT